MRLVLMIAVLGLVACDGSDRKPQKLADASGELPSETCVSAKARERLMKEPVSDVAAWQLANHFGICASDGVGQERWLKVLARRGNAKAAAELAKLLRYQPGREGESKQWQDAVDKKVAP